LKIHDTKPDINVPKINADMQ